MMAGISPVHVLSVTVRGKPGEGGCNLPIAQERKEGEVEEENMASD